MSAHPEITKGGIARLIKNEKFDCYVQVVEVVRFMVGEVKSDKDRYRLVLSDGTASHTAMLSTQNKSLVENGSLKARVIIKVTQAMCNELQGKMVLVLLELEVVSAPLPEVIGNPQPSGGSSMPAPAPTPAAPQAAAPDARAVMPINNLNPYQNMWTIRARVTSKSNLRTFTNARGTGKVFSIDLLDSSGGQIRGTFFNDAATVFYDMLEQEKVYFFSNASVRFVKNPKFNTVPNDYEIMFEASSKITPSLDEAGIASRQFRFVPFSDLRNIKTGDSCDIVGVVTNIGEMSSFRSKKTGEDVPRRTLTLVDSTNHSVELTLFDQKAEAFTHPVGSVMVVRTVRTSDYNQLSLSTTMSSEIFYDMECPEVTQLKSWYAAKPNLDGAVALTVNGGSAGAGSGDGNRNTPKPIASIDGENMGMNGKSDFVIVHASINTIKHDLEPWYKSCPEEGCSKKVTEDNAQWRCESCNQVYSNYQPRYVLSMSISDYSGNKWCTAFNEAAETILGTDATTMETYYQNHREQYEKEFQKPLYKTFEFLLAAELDTYGENQRVRMRVIKISPVQYTTGASNLIESIKRLQAV